MVLTAEPEIDALAKVSVGDMRVSGKLVRRRCTVAADGADQGVYGFSCSGRGVDPESLHPRWVVHGSIALLVSGLGSVFDASRTLTPVNGCTPGPRPR
jgi:hypothetical protein